MNSDLGSAEANRGQDSEPIHPEQPLGGVNTGCRDPNYGVVDPIEPNPDAGLPTLAGTYRYACVDDESTGECLSYAGL